MSTSIDLVNRSISGWGPPLKRPPQRGSDTFRRPFLGREPPEPDEARRVLVTERITFVVGRERVVVESARRATADRLAEAGSQSQANLAGDVGGGGLGERIDRLPQRREPE